MQAAQFQTNYETERKHWWFSARRHILGSLAREVVPPSPATVIVDVGCGTGSNINYFAQDYRCIGIDPTPEAIELAQQRFPQVKLICGEAPQDLPEEARQARLFLMTDVLEHVQHDAALFRQMVEFAPSGSYFLVTVPAYMSLWSPHDVSHGHYRRYTKAGFAQLFQGLPLQLLLLSHYNTRLFLVIKAVRLFNRLRGKAIGRAGTDVYLPAAPLNYILYRMFAGEKHRLLRLLRGHTRNHFPFGVSLLALLRKE